MDLSKHNPDPHNVQYLLSILRGDDEQSYPPPPASQSDLPLSNPYFPSEHGYDTNASNNIGQAGSHSGASSRYDNVTYPYIPSFQGAAPSSAAGPSGGHQASVDPRPRTTSPTSARSSPVENKARTQQPRTRLSESITPPAGNSQASQPYATTSSAHQSKQDSPSGEATQQPFPVKSTSPTAQKPSASSPTRNPSQQLMSLPAALPTLRTLSKSPKFLRLLMNLKRQQDTLEKSLKYEHGELVAAKASSAEMSKWKAEALERWDEQMEIQQAQLGEAGLPNFWKTKSKVAREAQREVLDVLGGMVGK